MKKGVQFKALSISEHFTQHSNAFPTILPTILSLRANNNTRICQREAKAYTYIDNCFLTNP